ncbi:hypothetical protein Pyn_13331 [Prunus yedoensis var. nudiflora]|uniref:Uncharacterized protein n=1 Tax=Prunus yedoensis var. nudiflora TaxID=2094558 RepID=A0A314UXH4_PRUYE|nr:hypothetical protein Pyn_13331 [Prunus yedoensis var. nudiflora]
MDIMKVWRNRNLGMGLIDVYLHNGNVVDNHDIVSARKKRQYVFLVQLGGGPCSEAWNTF